MADKLIANRDDPSVIERYRDMGDGSWSRIGGALNIVGTPVAASSGNVAAGVAAASLAAVAGKTNYVSGIEITGGGATLASLVIATLSGLLGGTLSYIVGAVAGVLLPNAPIVISFNPPLPAAAVNTAITLSCPSLGAGSTNSAVAIHGFQV